MGGTIDRAVPLLKAIVTEIREENITFIAGSIAYSAFVSLLPLLLFMLLLLSVVGDQSLTNNVIQTTGTFLAPNARNVLFNSLSNNSATTGASIVGIVTLLWGTLKIFRGLDTAFSEIYDTESESSIADQFRDGLIVLFAIVLAIGAAVAAGAAFALFPHVPFLAVINPILLVLGLSIAFFPIYYVFPDVDLEPREVLPGVLVAAVGWALLEAIFQGYAVFAERYEVYGAIGSVLVIVTWLYFSGLVLLIGAVVNAVLAGRTDNTPVDEGDERKEGDERGEGEETDERARPASEPGTGGTGTDSEREREPSDESLADEHEELERAYEYLRRAHRNRVREVEKLRRERERSQQPIWVRVKWWLFGRPGKAP